MILVAGDSFACFPNGGNYYNDNTVWDEVDHFKTLAEYLDNAHSVGIPGGCLGVTTLATLTELQQHPGKYDRVLFYVTDMNRSAVNTLSSESDYNQYLVDNMPLCEHGLLYTEQTLKHDNKKTYTESSLYPGESIINKQPVFNRHIPLHYHNNLSNIIMLNQYCVLNRIDIVFITPFYNAISDLNNMGFSLKLFDIFQYVDADTFTIDHPRVSFPTHIFPDEHERLARAFINLFPEWS